MSETARTVEMRITDYLCGGGLFKPGLANQDAVRDLLIDARDALTAERERADRAQEDAERIAWLQLYATMAESDNPDEVEAADEIGDSLREIFIANGGDLRAAIDAARRK